jgi:Animal haem peroxidase
MRLLAGALTSLGTTLLLVGSVSAKDQDFVRMFPKLPPLEAPDSALANHGACTPAPCGGASTGPMVDPNLDADNSPRSTPAGFTYFGQFVDHDVTRDENPLPDTTFPIELLDNVRNAKLDLDSVYGPGSVRDPVKPDKMLTGPDGGDLPRGSDGRALIADSRNDENMIIAQLHLAFLKFHNAMVDRGMNFEQARQATINHYQWVVTHDFLPRVLHPDYAATVLTATANKFFKPSNPHDPNLPIEWAVAGYRFGHSMVRLAYRVVAPTPEAPLPPNVQVFNGTAGDLSGGRPIPDGSDPSKPNRRIHWPNFVQVEGFPAPLNISRKIDALLSRGLFQLPVPAAIPGGPNSLASRNIIRAKRYELPSGQDVARTLGVPVLTNEEVGIFDPAFGGEAPVWVYLLAESGVVYNGAHLGPVGSMLVSEVFGGMLQLDPDGIVRTGWTPEGGTFTLGDFLSTAGVVP